jgi:isocitrate lyase
VVGVDLRIGGADEREVGAGYFDQVMQKVTGGQSSTLSLPGSTEEAQFA